MQVSETYSAPMPAWDRLTWKQNNMLSCCLRLNKLCTFL